MMGLLYEMGNFGGILINQVFHETHGLAGFLFFFFLTLSLFVAQKKIQCLAAKRSDEIRPPEKKHLPNP